MTSRVALLIMEALKVATSENEKVTYKCNTVRKFKKRRTVEWHVNLITVGKDSKWHVPMTVFFVRRSGKLILLGHQYEYVKAEEVKSNA